MEEEWKINLELECDGKLGPVFRKFEAQNNYELFL